MYTLSDLFIPFLDTLTGHLVLTLYLLAVTDERAVWRRLKKFPPLLLSPLTVTLLAAGLYTVPELRIYEYFISSFLILILCTLWVRWAWQFGLWQAFAATCMAGIFQVAQATLSFALPIPFPAAIGLHLVNGILIVLLLYRLRFGRWFRLLLDNASSIRQTALLLFALEAAMELFLRLARGVSPPFLIIYYLMVGTVTALTATLVVYLARQFYTAQKIQAQQDIIDWQHLYEQDLETIRREVRTFRHDYKNLLSGLSRQAGEGNLEELCHTLSELDAGFDLQLGKKIQTSTQIGNVQLPEVRSLLLSKLAAMQKKGVEYALEVLYPFAAVHMDVWDFVRCLGILTDNAMEAALDTEQPRVEIVLLAQDGHVFLRVSNSYKNLIEPEHMWNDGWSTKGDGRGLGLSSYQHILKKYRNASPCTSWENGVFVQELTVEGQL